MGPFNFSKSRDRLLAGNTAAAFLAQLLDQPRVRRLVSSEHFGVDGSLVEAWASMKSFRPKGKPGAPPTDGRKGSGDLRGERRAGDNNASTTDPDARLYRTGQEAKAVLRRTRADGEPAWSGGRSRGDPRPCRAARGGVDARPAADCGSGHARGRPWLRRP
jgi:hypothetical protein